MGYSIANDILHRNQFFGVENIVLFSSPFSEGVSFSGLDTRGGAHYLHFGSREVRLVGGKLFGFSSLLRVAGDRLHGVFDGENVLADHGNVFDDGGIVFLDDETLDAALGLENLEEKLFDFPVFVVRLQPQHQRVIQGGDFVVPLEVLDKFAFVFLTHFSRGTFPPPSSPGRGSRTRLRPSCFPPH